MAPQKNQSFQDQTAYQTLLSHSYKYIHHPTLKKLHLFVSHNILTDFFLTIIFPLAICSLYIMGMYVTGYKDIANFYIVFMFLAVLNTAVGGQKATIVTLLVGSFGGVYFFNPLTSSSDLISFMVFLIAAGATGFIVNETKKVDLLLHYKKREERYARQFTAQNDALEKAKEEIKARDEFLSIASHELKTPLTSMLLQLDKTLHDVRNVSLAKFSIPDLMKVLENAEKQVKNLAKMINDLLNISLITTGRLKLDLEEVELGHVIRDVMANLGATFKKEGYKVSVKTQPKVMGKLDRVKLEQVVTNLLTNAIKYGEKKPIEVKLTSFGSLAWLSVSDHGIGIEPDKISVLFDRFKRGVSDKGRARGLGVGLYMSKQIVNAHGGKIKVSSRIGRGSTFTVELPLRK